MNGPKRLWSGDWSGESAAERERLAARRAARPRDDGETPEPEPGPARASVAARARAALAAGWQRARTLASSGLRTRLAIIAVVAALTGAAVTVAVEAATDDGSPASATQSDQAWLGVLAEPATGQSGALVALVVPGGPAASAGVQLGDVITSVNGRGVASPEALTAAIGSYHPGEAVALGVERFGQSVTVDVTLSSRPAGTP